MTDDTKANSLRELSEFLDRPKVVRIGDREFTVAKLRPIDLADARDHVISRRLIRHIKTTRHMNFDPMTRAQTMAAIESANLSTYDVIQDPEGRLKMIHTAITRHDPECQMTLEQVRRGLDPMTQDELFAFAMYISGVWDDPPAVTTSKTSPTEGDDLADFPESDAV